MSKKLISLLMTIALLVSAVFNSYASEVIPTSVLAEIFIRQELFKQYSLIYDTFSAAITLRDGTEITGIGFTDYSRYYEDEESSVGYFSAGFIADYGSEIPETETENGLVIENLDFSDEKIKFIYDYETAPFMEHCVKDGQYLKYGVNDRGTVTYETAAYERDVCDENLGALYSYDAGKFVFDPNVGDYIRINGITLFDQVDFAAVESQINQIIADQNTNLNHEEIVSTVNIAHEAIVSYLLSMQEEIFLGYKVTDLVESASQLDPMQCIRITPEGYVIVDIGNGNPETADGLTKLLVGAFCLIFIAGSIAIDVFIPAAHPLSGAIMGAATDAFMQVVIENKTLANVQWGKVAVAATSGAIMAWLCPMAAAEATKRAIRAGASEALGKAAGYGVLTFCNSIVSGGTKLALAEIDGKNGDWNTFLTGAMIGAIGTVGASIFSEAISAAGPKVSEVLSRTKVGEWVGRISDKAGRFIQNHQIHLKNSTLEDILSPKSVHMAAKSAMEELNGQTGTMGGNYKKLTGSGDGTIEKHEIPSCSAYKKAKGIDPQTNRDQLELPAIKMSAEDHALTASYRNSSGAIAYRAQQEAFIAHGNMHSAIMMDIDNIHTLFAGKYDRAIAEALVYAAQKGWWRPWAENTGLWNQIIESMGLSLEEIMD